MFLFALPLVAAWHGRLPPTHPRLRLVRMNERPPDAVASAELTSWLGAKYLQEAGPPVFDYPVDWGRERRRIRSFGRSSERHGGSSGVRRTSQSQQRQPPEAGQGGELRHHQARTVHRRHCASHRLNVRPLMSCAPSAKRPLGEVARYARPTSRRVCCVAIRCTEWPSTIVPCPRAPSARDAKCSELSMLVNTRTNRGLEVLVYLPRNAARARPFARRLNASIPARLLALRAPWRAPARR